MTDEAGVLGGPGRVVKEIDRGLLVRGEVTVGEEMTGDVI